MMLFKKKNQALITCLAGALALTGCSVDAPTAPSASPAKSASGNTEGPVTLAVWDNYTTEEQSKALDEIIASFESENKNIKIKRTPMKVEDQRKLIKPALTSKKGPDIFAYDSGPGYLGELAKAGLLLDLTPYSQKLNWNSRFPGWIQERNTFSSKLYGIGTQVEMLGVYYNKDIFKQLGVQQPPATYEDFMKIVKLAKDQKITAISMDDKDQWPAFHLESVFYTSFAGKEKVEAVLNKKESFNQPVFAEALDTLANLVKEGYTTKSPLAISYDDGNKEFFSGKAAMRITGSWLVSDALKNMKDNVGFFILPAAKPNVMALAPGGIGGVFTAASSTPYPEETVKFLDYMFAEKNGKVWYKANVIPPLKADSSTLGELNPLFRDVVNVTNRTEGLSYSIDIMLPQKTNDVTMNILQELIAGKKSGADVVKEKQKAFEDDIAKGNY
ncbi:MAG: extracellular solute-binding protein [Paenibacillus sp.]|jgi:raffinose/stachyose/melibiose transport system substrate-binding protein|nr:extracellular solute-binding protein [Paenibacillus sp.]